MRQAVALTRVALAVTLLLTATSPTHGQKTERYRVIVHPSNPVTSLPRATVSALFLKQERTWARGMPVLPIDLGERSPVRAEFSKAVHRRVAGAVKAYWNQRAFLGRDVPPPEVATDAQVVAYVAANPGAVGYVSPTAHFHHVKTIHMHDGRAR